MNLKKGDRFYFDLTNYVKIMAIEDGYVMARNKGCAPFCETIKKFNERVKSYQFHSTKLSFLKNTKHIKRITTEQIITPLSIKP